MIEKLLAENLATEFEVETCKPDPSSLAGEKTDDIRIIKFSSIKKILSLLGFSVKVESEPEFAYPIIGYKVIVSDDTGRVVEAHGSVNCTCEKGIAKRFALETAWSRALSNAVIEYCGFPGRVYSDQSIATLADIPEVFAEEEIPVATEVAEETVIVAPSKIPTEKTVKKEEPKKEEPKKEEPKKEEPKEVVVEPSSPAVSAASAESGEWRMTFGKYKGTKISEVFEKDRQYLDWAVENQKGFIRARIIKYLAAKEGETK